MKVWDWSNADGWRFQAVADTDKVTLWYLPGTTVWEIGHSVPLSKGLSAADIVDSMQRFIAADKEEEVSK